jgi:hypothetical protein
MSTLYIAEFTSLPFDAHGQPVMAPAMPPVAEQTVAISGSHAESTAFGGSTRFAQISCDVICSIAFGTAPVATTSNQRLAANETRFVGVIAGQKVSVVTNT